MFGLQGFPTEPQLRENPWRQVKHLLGVGDAPISSLEVLSKVSRRKPLEPCKGLPPLLNSGSCLGLASKSALLIKLACFSIGSFVWWCYQPELLNMYSIFQEASSSPSPSLVDDLRMLSFINQKFDTSIEQASQLVKGLLDAAKHLTLEEQASLEAECRETIVKDRADMGMNAPDPLR